MWSAGHHKILPPKIPIFSRFQISRILLPVIFLVPVAEKIFFWKIVLLWYKQHIKKQRKSESVSIGVCLILTEHWLLNMSSSEYSRTVNMSRFWISRVTQGLHIFVNMTGLSRCNYGRVLNIPRSLICCASAYTRFWICLSMAE